MKSSKPDIASAGLDPFVEALRADLPDARDEARVRARLCAAGVLVTGAALTTEASAALGSGSAAGSGLAGSAAASGTSGGALLVVTGAAAPSAAGAAVSGATLAGGLGAAAPVVAKVGVLSKLLLLPAAVKVGAAATLAVAAATSAPLMLERLQPAATVTPRSVEAPAVAPAPGTSQGSAPPAYEAAPGDVAGTPEGGASRAAAVPAAAVPAAAVRPDAALESGVAHTGERATPRRSRVRSSADDPRPQRPPAARERAARQGAAAEQRSQPPPVSALSEEARLIEQAMLALGAGDDDGARRFLEEHARRFPAGALAREREKALERLLEAAP